MRAHAHSMLAREGRSKINRYDDHHRHPTGDLQIHVEMRVSSHTCGMKWRRIGGRCSCRNMCCVHAVWKSIRRLMGHRASVWACDAERTPWFMTNGEDVMVFMTPCDIWYVEECALYAYCVIWLFSPSCHVWSYSSFYIYMEWRVGLCSLMFWIDDVVSECMWHRFYVRNYCAFRLRLPIRVSRQRHRNRVNHYAWLCSSPFHLPKIPRAHCPESLSLIPSSHHHTRGSLCGSVWLCLDFVVV